MPLVLVLVLGLAACGTGSDLEPAAQTPRGGPRPYLTATSSRTPTPWLAAVESALPTPTPLTYTVVYGDTLIGIAGRFGISLEELMAANPGIQPNALSVGTVLFIPVGGSISDEPTPTPVPLAVQQARCYPTPDGGLWCFVLVQNDYAETLENLLVQVTLLDAAGQTAAAATAYAPLNILPPGKSMPLAVFFQPPIAPDLQPRVQLLTAIRLLPGDTRYLPAFLGSTLVDVDWSGRTAQVTGRVMLPAESAAANLVWVVGVAYDEAGNVVGLRRWEATSSLQPGGGLPFEFIVSSLGSPIARVELLVEARP